MRIVIDMQGAQTESRFRGIGRYTLSLTKAIIRHRDDHEIILALNGLFPDTIEPIRSAFKEILPQENIRVWHAPGPVNEENPENESRRLVAELIREAFLADLQPDVVHVHSLIEGFNDNAVLSIGQLKHDYPVTVTLHDLIPLLYPVDYLESNPPFARYYQNKIRQLMHASLLLSISESSSREAIDHLGVPATKVCNTLEAAEPVFREIEISKESAQRLYHKFGLHQSFVLYSGGADKRKNLPRLIHAFAELPKQVRAQHQLLFAGKIPGGVASELRSCAKKFGLQPDELVFTGFVTDHELLQLYNLCKVYVFPSWHEGFGLPALEAMSCGAPVIGANTSSLPEVIGLNEALFDPSDVHSIADKLAQSLLDSIFRKRLRAHGRKQALKFSWDESAKQAIAAWESLYQKHHQKKAINNTEKVALKLPMKICERLRNPSKLLLNEIASCLALNQQSAIRRQLFLDISEIHTNDAATGVQRVVRSYLKALLNDPPAGFVVEPIYATRDKGYHYARRFTRRFLVEAERLYSPTEDAGLDKPIQWQRGDLFFGLDMQHHVQLTHADTLQKLRADGVVVKFLVHDLLPIQLADLFKDQDAKEMHERWLSMIASMDGAICVSRATADAFDNWINKASPYQTPGFQMAWVHNGGDLDGSSPSRGLPKDAPRVLKAIRNRPSFLSVSTLEPRKGQQQIFNAIQQLWQLGHNVNLVLVGKQGCKVDQLANSLRRHPENGKRLFWLEGISDEYLEHIYQASTGLIAASIDEGFGLVLVEAARYHLPVIARDIPVFREIANDSAYYFTGESSQVLAETLSAWLAMHDRGEHPNSSDVCWQTWKQSAEQLKVKLTAECYSRKQLLVDVSELIQRDARSGIQRVVRSILHEWLKNPPADYRVEPVYGSVEDGYRYARAFTRHFAQLPWMSIDDELIDYAPGDIFFGLDMKPQVQIAKKQFYQTMRNQGVKVKFLLHDLLPIQMPEFFPQGNEEGFTQWLKVITATDGVICVSKTVAEELREWVAEHCEVRDRSLHIDWYHNGANIDKSVPSHGLTEDAEKTLSKLRARPTFLLVGTVEPRKGQAQVLEAFDQLWNQRQDVNLVIVGKAGWQVEELIDKIKTHPKLNTRLFWLAGISDEYLEKVYDVSTCLIAASYGEGFGLPLIEAAQHNLPVIARDIPVFREVAGKASSYFNVSNGTDLAHFLQVWLAEYKKGRTVRSVDMKWQLWAESSAQLLNKIII